MKVIIDGIEYVRVGEENWIDKKSKLYQILMAMKEGKIYPSDAENQVEELYRKKYSPAKEEKKEISLKNIVYKIRFDQLKLNEGSDSFLENKIQQIRDLAIKTITECYVNGHNEMHKQEGIDKLGKM